MSLVFWFSRVVRYLRSDYLYLQVLHVPDIRICIDHGEIRYLSVTY